MKLLLIFQGEVNVGQNMLPMFLKTAESLQVRGLTENNTLNPKVITFQSLTITGTIIYTCSCQINLILCMYNYGH